MWETFFTFVALQNVSSTNSLNLDRTDFPFLILQNDTAADIFATVFTQGFNVVAWCHINILWLCFTKYFPQDLRWDLNPLMLLSYPHCCALLIASIFYKPKTWITITASAWLGIWGEQLLVCFSLFKGRLESVIGALVIRQEGFERRKDKCNWNDVPSLLWCCSPRLCTVNGKQWKHTSQ